MKRLTKASFGTTPLTFEAAVANALHKEEPMKRKRFATVLVMAILIIALACTAVAVGINQSARHAAVRAAREAIMAQYGLTTEMLGMFSESTEPKDDGFEIVFAPLKYINEIGEYTVLVMPGAEPEATWSHDDKNLPGLADAGMDSAVWGPAQIGMVMDVERGYRENLRVRKEWTDAESLLAVRAENDRPLVEAMEQGVETFVVNLMPGEADIPLAEVLDRAGETILKKFGVDLGGMEGYHTDISFLKYQDDAEPKYRVSIIKADEKNPSKEENVIRTAEMFDVTIFSPSGDIGWCVWHVDADRRTLPDGPLHDYKDAVAKFIEEGAFNLQTPEKKADIAARMEEAGFGSLLEGRKYAAPDQSDLPEAEAIERAGQAMRDTFHMTDEAIALFDRSASLVEEDGRHVWTNGYTAKPDLEWQWRMPVVERLGAYEIAIDAKDGTMLREEWTLAGERGDEDYTKNTWGRAKAYDGEILTWAIKLMEAQKKIDEPYTGGDPLVMPDVSLEDTAAKDQLMRDAGFPADQYSNGVPGPKDLAQGVALEIGIAALAEEYGIDRAKLEGAVMSVYFSVADPDAPEWSFWIFPSESGYDDYSVTLNARTGEILRTDYSATGNG